MRKRRTVYYADAGYDAAFHACMDILAELIEKYGEDVLCENEDRDYTIYANHIQLQYERVNIKLSYRLKKYARLTCTDKGSAAA